jgi:alpha,alpha-trehalase
MKKIYLCWLVMCAWVVCGLAQRPDVAQANGGLPAIVNYIRSDWNVLTRSMSRCESVVDPKLPQGSVLYLPAGFEIPAQVKKMEASCQVRLEALPVVIRHPGEPQVANIEPQGLLYLPNSYVVPGGRFNEMYGWDSYFIILGLLQDGRTELARGMVENFFFEIEHYGTVLNANRTYYLTRSQPPFLSSMILAVCEAQKATGGCDRTWLQRAYSFASQDYEMWLHEPHLAGQTGLSRYYDFGTGPAAESLKDETGLRRRVIGYFLLHPEWTGPYVVKNSDTGPTYAVQVCDASDVAERAACDSTGKVQLSAEYYKGDRSMRESGFDISFRFEPYGAATQHFAPVCLNSLLYKTEKDLEQISRELGKEEDAKTWEQRAEQRKALIDRYLWDGKRGLFFDFNFDTGVRSTYEYLTTFYPLWAGLASADQARAVDGNLKLFQQAGGLATSTNNSGGQWDYPYGWAPLHLLAVEGLRRYGYNSDADQVSYKFLSTVLENYAREGTIREKYNVVARSSEAEVSAGYKINVIGFGWTNGVFLRLLQALPPAEAEKLGKE